MTAPHRQAPTQSVSIVPDIVAPMEHSSQGPASQSTCRQTQVYPPQEAQNQELNRRPCTALELVPAYESQSRVPIGTPRLTVSPSVWRLQ